MESKRDAAKSVLDAALAFASAAYGEAVADRFRKLATDPDAERAPLTWRNRLKDEMERLFKERLLTPSDLARIRPLREAMQRKLLDPGGYDRKLVESAAGRTFARFLADARTVVGDAAFRALVDPLHDVGGWADLMVPGLDRDLAPTGSTFEERVRTVAAAIHRGAEVAYKPYLQVALKLTPTRSMPAPRVEVPDIVGALLVQCRDAWRLAPNLVQILYEDIEIVRNSEGHVQTQFDFDRETVTFVNRPRDRPAEIVGPWSESQLIEYGRGFFDLLSMLSLVYSASLR